MAGRGAGGDPAAAKACVEAEAPQHGEARQRSLPGALSASAGATNTASGGSLHHGGSYGCHSPERALGCGSGGGIPKGHGSLTSCDRAPLLPRCSAGPAADHAMMSTHAVLLAGLAWQ